VKTISVPPPNPRMQRTPSAPLMRQPLGASRLHLSVITSVILAIGCAHSNDQYVPTRSLPELGTPFHPTGIAPDIVFPGRTMEAYGISVAGIRYGVIVDSTNSRVVAISTADPKFSTPEGVKIGDTLFRLRNLPGRWLEPQRRFLLESGWAALIDAEERVFQFDKDTPSGA